MVLIWRDLWAPAERLEIVASQLGALAIVPSVTVVFVEIKVEFHLLSGSQTGNIALYVCLVVRLEAVVRPVGRTPIFCRQWYFDGGAQAEGVSVRAFLVS